MASGNAAVVDWENVKANVRDFFSIRSFTFIGTGSEIVYTRGEKTFRFTEPRERLICRQLCDAETVSTWLKDLQKELGPEVSDEVVRSELITRLRKMYRET